MTTEKCTVRLELEVTDQYGPRQFSNSEAIYRVWMSTDKDIYPLASARLYKAYELFKQWEQLTCSQR